jgi:serine/threonine protein kinase
VLLKEGRIAMSVVPGKELMGMKSDTKIGNTTAGDAYWKARADLHRLGIAHNDSHPGNLLIDKDGKGRWVDMGLAHDHPGAALAEALGVLRKPAGAIGVGAGDWQGQGWAAKTGNSDGRVTSFAPENLKRMQSNHDTKVLPFLQSKGLTNDEIGTVMTNGIRRPPTEYTTMKGFDKLNDNDALQAINLLYDGVK